MKIIFKCVLLLLFVSCVSKNITKETSRLPQQVAEEGKQTVKPEKLDKEKLSSLYKSVELHPYCQSMKSISKLKPSLELSNGQNIDLVLVSKATKKTYLFSGDQLIYEFHSAFGAGFKKGSKIQEGDKRTPEGIYTIISKNPHSKYHLSLKISYPNETDIAFAKKYNTPVGGDIMFHGLPNGFDEDEDMISAIMNSFNWTAGCVAMNNRSIETMYNLVQEGTTVAICPR